MAVSKSHSQPAVRKTWWQKLSKNQRLSLAVIVFITLIVIPLSLWASNNEVRVNPKASGPSDTGTATVNQTPSLNTGSLVNTLNCQVNQPCTASFTGTDNDKADRLTMDIDFLPPNLKQNTCETNNTPSRTVITCSFSGNPNRTGEFMVLITLKDKAGHTTQKTFNLNVR